MLTARDWTHVVVAPAIQRQDVGQITESSSKSDESIILGESEATRSLRLKVRLLGPHFRVVLVQGEPGTGKELTARALHRFSSHMTGPFVRFECGGNKGTPEALMTALKAAHRGTVYLQNVAAMRSNMQAMLLAVLQRRGRVMPNPIVIHGLEARIIASAAEDLPVAVASGHFLHELYRRISAVTIGITPLRERIEDIPALVRHFLKSSGIDADTAVDLLQNPTVAQWMEYRWPGNVGELKQAVSQAVQASHIAEEEPRRMDEAEAEHEAIQATPSALRLQEVVDQHVLLVLRECSGNKVRAAEALGISRSTLYRMLEAGLPEDTFAKLR